MTFESATQSIQECMWIKIFRKTYSLTVLENTKAQTKDNINNRFNVNKLYCNPNKTQHLKLNIHLITTDESVNVLGLHIDSKLK